MFSHRLTAPLSQYTHSCERKSAQCLADKHGTAEALHHITDARFENVSELHNLCPLWKRRR